MAQNYLNQPRRFQSHAGSIEAWRVGCGLFQQMMVFQSHAGSIEAVVVGQQDHWVRFCFNPTLVRLRLPYPNNRFPSKVRFQSHAGSIEATDPDQETSIYKTVSIPRWFD